MYSGNGLGEGKKKHIQQFYHGCGGCCVFQTVISKMVIGHKHKNQHIDAILELSKVPS